MKLTKLVQNHAFRFHGPKQTNRPNTFTPVIARITRLENKSLVFSQKIKVNKHQQSVRWITSAVALVTSDAAMRFRSTLLAVNWDWKGRDERKYTKPAAIDVKSVRRNCRQIFHGNCISTYSFLTLLEYNTELNLW